MVYFGIICASLVALPFLTDVVAVRLLGNALQLGAAAYHTVHTECAE